LVHHTDDGQGLDHPNLSINSASFIPEHVAIWYQFSGGLLAIGEVDDLHVIGSNGLRMGGDDNSLRGADGGTQRVIGGGGGLRVIDGDALGADGNNGHRAKRLILAPRRS
jgi:hypothetical protein